MQEIIKIKEYCEKVLDLENGRLSDEYYYQSLPLCVIDAVYSIGVKYTSTRNTGIRYCDYFNLKRIRDEKEEIPSKNEQESISQFLNKVAEFGTKRFTEEIFKNKQRTSPTNGILKSEAVLQFANILKEKNIEYLQDIENVISDEEIKSEIKDIPGQKSGISLQYFFMLAGSNEFVKPDRMVLRFLERILQRKVTIEEAQNLLVETSNNLKGKYTHITPRELDHEIWKYESSK